MAAQFLEVQGERLAHAAFGLLEGVPYGVAAPYIRRGCAPAPVACLLIDHVARRHRRFVQTRVPADAGERPRSDLAVRLSACGQGRLPPVLVAPDLVGFQKSGSARTPPRGAPLERRDTSSPRTGVNQALDRKPDQGHLHPETAGGTPGVSWSRPAVPTALGPLSRTVGSGAPRPRRRSRARAIIELRERYRQAAARRGNPEHPRAGRADVREPNRDQ